MEFLHILFLSPLCCDCGCGSAAAAAAAEVGGSAAAAAGCACGFNTWAAALPLPRGSNPGGGDGDDLITNSKPSVINRKPAFWWADAACSSFSSSFSPTFVISFCACMRTGTKSACTSPIASLQAVSGTLLDPLAPCATIAKDSSPQAGRKNCQARFYYSKSAFTPLGPRGIALF